MAVFERDQIEEDVLEDLLEEINELYEASQQTLMDLELHPEDVDLQRALFRYVHTIKGDLGLVGFNPIISLVSHVEDLLDYLRNGKMQYTSTMSDLVLLTMDRVKIFVEEAINSGQVTYDDVLFDQLVRQIKRINPNNAADHEHLMTGAVLLLDPSLDATQDVVEEDEIPEDKIPPDLGIDPKSDIAFFRELVYPIERRSHYWRRRSDRILKLARFVNEMAGNPVDPEQLSVACYVHDFGMAFIPINVVHKPSSLTKDELELIKGHVRHSASLLDHMSYWSGAQEIVRQHHERVDGSGYPNNLSGDQICDGAKLLAIVDTFDALTHERAYETHVKRPKRRALYEINTLSAQKLDAKWVGYFNNAMKVLMQMSQQNV